MTTTTEFRVQAQHIKTTRITSGWHTYNTRYNGESFYFEIFKSEDGGGLGWDVYRREGHGTASRKLVATVASLVHARAAIASVFNEGQTVEEAIAALPARRKAAVAPTPEEVGVKVGDFFYTSWGYDQTNVEFYQVVGLTPKGVKIRQVVARLVDTYAGGEEIEPIKDRFIGEVETKRLQRSGCYKGASVSFSSYRSGWLWDGTPKHQTAAGYGH